MEEQKAKSFAEEKFKQLDEVNQKWNFLHSKFMIEAIKELTLNEKIIDKLKPLAWIHDIGKTISNEEHAKLSLGLLKNFGLDEIEEDCILNHGTKGDPKSEEAKIFQKADGISIFYPEIIDFQISVETKEGKNLEEIKKEIIEQYQKYAKAYQNSPDAIRILNSKFKSLNLN